MENKSTKAPVMKSKASTSATRKTKAKATTATATTATATVSPVSEKMSKLETAYMAAISGEMKFGEVKSIFKQLHKEIKKSAKSKN
jgi:hypothetical protein